MQNSLLLSSALGLMTGLSLIVAIGSQNAYLLRLGVTASRSVMLPVVTVCALSDAVLIIAGVAGVGALVQSLPVVMTVIRAVGAAFLIGYGVLAAKRALKPTAMAVDAGTATGAGDTDAETDAGRGRRSLISVLLTVLAFTWLNPHVYIDTVVLLGSLAQHQTHPWWWAAGAILSSFVWFYALGFGARMLRPLFAKPRAWQILDICIAVIMFALGLRLLLGF
ncbi:LysE/ArgO family amino acid transporter [Pseudoclavibacter sp. CFCC 11306]|uniref:LysE/ArgO family amino acid transporter n=1 Tax=Pseudoclavibacter sp. CFCC 11306 TaxID=1564493 RepID=UPI0013016E59|nr:LysE/ArgO family amino acid transporter [Pseudoclavibacter sp. CFCC 11306]KAB1659031.1 amino acid transporter [Pseudoclavibacter sp. CFCC 11306]